MKEIKFLLHLALQWFDVPEPPHFDNPGARK